MEIIELHPATANGLMLGLIMKVLEGAAGVVKAGRWTFCRLRARPTPVMLSNN